jgi:hypothetical protein
MTVRSADVSAFYELIYNPKYTPKRSPKAHLEQIPVEGESKIMLLKEPGEYFEIDEPTSVVWNLLDGNRTLKQIWEDAKKIDEKITEKEVKDIVLSLAQIEVLESTEPEIEERRVRLVSAVQLEVRLVKDSSETFRNFFKITRKLIKRTELPVALAIILLGLALSFGSLIAIFSAPTKFEILGSTLFGLFIYEEIVLLPVFLIHELSHAAVCDYYGAKPREIGTGFYYFAPFFFCDTSDSWRLNRKARIMISAAGPLSTLLMGSMFTFVSYLPNLGFGKTILQVASFFCFYGSLINFSPMLEMDGYYIISDILNLPNLRDESFAYLKRTFLGLFGRPVKKIRYGARRRRILLIYSILAIGWLLFTAYTTVRLTYFYSLSAYAALLILFKTASGSLSFSLANLGIGVGSLLYYFLLIAGYVIMGVVAYQKIRIRGVKLETIHDKRVSIFLPLPSFVQRERALRLVQQAKGASRKLTRSFSVVWEAPLCVAALKMGKVDQSLDDVKKDMASVEKSFRSVHNKFLLNNLQTFSEEGPSKKTRELLNKLASQFPPFQKGDFLTELSKFLERQDRFLAYLLQSAFGDVWTLELPPDDYRRIRRELFPSLIAEDLGAMDLEPELEHFKRHTILGLDALAKLSSEQAKESSLVTRNPEQYQATASIDPVKSRLVFLGRTEGIEQSIIWIGGLFLYQAWIGYISEVLYESAIGLESINQTPYSSFGRAQIAKLSHIELLLLSQNFGDLEQLRNDVIEAISRIRSSYLSANNFHEALAALLEDQNFDIGLYKPILLTNQEHLKILNDKIIMFEEEFERGFDQLSKTSAMLSEQLAKTGAEPKETASSSSSSSLSLEKLKLLLPFLKTRDKYSPSYYGEVKRLFALVRLLYPVVLESAVVI